MQRLWVCFLILLFAVAITGCPSISSSTSTPSNPPIPRSPDEKKAMELAGKYLDTTGLNWGQPKEIRPEPEAGKFWLAYPTPEDEVKLLGERSVTVNVTSGKVAL